jgi:hypothetical protein
MTTKIKAPYTSGQTLTATVTEQDDSNPVSATSVTGVDSVYTAVFPTIPDGVYVVRFSSGATAVRADLVRVSADREFNWVASEDLAQGGGSNVEVLARLGDPAGASIAADIARVAEPVLTVPQSVIDTASLPSDTKQIARGTQWSDRIEGIGDLTGITAVYYALKMGDVEDDQATLLVRKNLNGATGDEGIVRLAGEEAAKPSDAIIVHSTYEDEEITKNRFVVTVEGEASALIEETLSNTASSRFGFTRSNESNGYIRGWKLVGDNDQDFPTGRMRVKRGIVDATD